MYQTLDRRRLLERGCFFLNQGCTPLSGRVVSPFDFQLSKPLDQAGIELIAVGTVVNARMTIRAEGCNPTRMVRAVIGQTARMMWL